MNYPVWQLGYAGGGLLIAWVATLHVFVAHFAVGGGLFLVLTELAARRRRSPALVAYVKAHTRFFLVLTMVFGALSGVGIWLVISALSPGAASTLIHNFVWGWATEWVFFLGEVVALLVYHYGFDTMDPRDHMRVGWIYALFAWLSLVVITGIIGVMLTPGRWLETRDFWDGFFSPSFWPAVAIRTGFATMLAGVFGFLTAVRVTDEPARRFVRRRCAAWAALSVPLILLFGWWYLKSLGPGQYDFIVGRSAEITPYFRAMPFLGGGVLLLALALGLVGNLPKGAGAILSGVLVLTALGFLGGFEFIREAGRKPWLIPGHTWANGVRPDQVSDRQAPFLPGTAWARNKTVTPANLLDAGRELFAFQCLSCHSVGGPMNDIRRRTAPLGVVGITAYLTGQGKLFSSMPPFLGSADERLALASYLTATVNGKSLEPAPPVVVKPLQDSASPFDPDTDQYVLLAWNTLGMKCISDCDGFFSLLPPGNALEAVLIRRDPLPQMVSQDVSLTYEAQPGFSQPARQVAFWKHAKSLVGKDLPENVSPVGRKTSGAMAFNASSKVFEAVGIPVVPYTDSGEVNPYPLFTVVARDASGKELARTQAVAPVSSEMGCHTCHGGTWRVGGVTGLSDATAQGVLAVHDRRNKTDLVARAKAGGPVLCQSCHPDPLLNATGRGELLNLPAAIHGFHANYLGGLGDDACASCHPDSPTGVTRCLRDNHAAKGLGCSRCHGFLEDHALSLLNAEKAAGKPSASWLMANLAPRLVKDAASVAPRQPWRQEPDCMTCHKDYQLPDLKASSAFNAWTSGPDGLYRNRKEETGNVPCAACHGAPHATYPAHNAYGANRDTLQPLQYMGTPGVLGSKKRCDVCHTMEMEGDVHHANIVR
ncbi:cytochrome ubiquinol oxidase subunit I [Fundidesulfovibrio butyratiphilus]